MRKNKNGFTLAELLIVIAIIAVLVAVSIPIFSSQLEKSREAVDLANVRNAYSQVMMAAMVEDTSSPLYQNGTYQIVVPLKQTQDGWTMDKNNLVVGGISYADDVHWWRKDPRAKGRCRVYYTNGEAFLNWCGETYINTVSAQDFLTKDILQEIVGNDYKHTVINSNETYEQGEGTKKFIDYAKKHGFDLSDYGAATWQIYVKEPGKNEILTHPAIYWSTVDLSSEMVGTFVPVMGYRDGKYDVYYAEVVTNNQGKTTEYNTIRNNFANVTEAGGNATFQFDNYEDAKAAYDRIFTVYQQNGTLTDSDMAANNLKDKK
ncbi:type IV pilin protein [Oscillibacter sp.]|uniref:type IV pilin protein n=1 Tax=Oscillibacter sp. TaxID=1945593 RepID=UPI001B6663BE|nr:type II secretion system protein [Oscillibacter sp.]MBP3509263.1 type II secretion system protein [Oscillibacter sp.]